jgi:hypothetical protein
MASTRWQGAEDAQEQVSVGIAMCWTDQQRDLGSGEARVDCKTEKSELGFRIG